MSGLSSHEKELLHNQVSPTSTVEETGSPRCGTSNEETCGANDCNQQVLEEEYKQIECRRQARIHSADHHGNEHVAKLKSPLEAMAMIACSIGASLHEHDREAPRCYPSVPSGPERRTCTKTITDDGKIEDACEGHEVSDKSRFLNAASSIPRSNFIRSPRGNRQGGAERISEVSEAFDELKKYTHRRLAEVQRLISQQYDIHTSGTADVRNELNGMKTEMQEFKEECLQQLRAMNAGIQGRNISKALEEGTELRLTTERNKNSLFVISAESSDGAGTSEDGNMEGVMRTEATALTISVERNEDGKRALAPSGSRSSGREIPERAHKIVKTMRLEKQETALGFGGDDDDDSERARSGKCLKPRERDTASCEGEEKGAGGLAASGAGRAGSIAVSVASRGNKRGKHASGGVVKRKRDNWTGEENTVFMSMVLGNLEMNEMDLRRMLARHFAPRRTHEQCANHLRILRAQNRLPPATEDLQCAKSTRNK